jgi:hypothetical protein
LRREEWGGGGEEADRDTEDDRVNGKSLLSPEIFPQRLKPQGSNTRYGATKVAPLQNNDFFSSLKCSLPAELLRAEGGLLHSDSV